MSNGIKAKKASPSQESESLHQFLEIDIAECIETWHPFHSDCEVYDVRQNFSYQFPLSWHIPLVGILPAAGNLACAWSCHGYQTGLGTGGRQT